MMHPSLGVALDAAYDGLIRITVVLGPWRNDDDGERLVELVDGFLMLGDRGAFVREFAHPCDARMWITETKHMPPTQYIWYVDIRGVDSRFARVLGNQLIMFHHAFSPIARAAVEMLQFTRPQFPRPLPPIDAVAVEEGLVYPPCSSQLGFAVIHEQLVGDYRSDRRAEIEFGGVIDDHALEALRAWFEPWPGLLDCGYAITNEQLDHGAHAIFDAQTDIIDDMTIETSVGAWGGSEMAWNGYVNLAGRADREIGRIVAVRIY